MKRSSALVAAVVLLGSAALVSLNDPSSAARPAGGVAADKSAAAPTRAQLVIPAVPPAQGMLWETVARSARDRAVTTMPVAAEAFAAALTIPAGNPLPIVLSRQMPTLAATVSGRSVAPDGTTITRLRISGPVPGTLILQQNVTSGFFLGQLYYDGLAVAYEFRTTADGMSATRHELDDLICAFVNPREHTVEGLGMPPVDLACAKQAKDKDAANNNIYQIQEGKSTTMAAAGVTLSVNAVAAAEGNSGTNELVFAVRLSKADSRKIVSVKYATADGSATAGTDYTAVAGTLSFPRGSTSQQVAVAILGDASCESDESFTLNLSGPLNATLADASGVGTILNDDSAPVIPQDPPPSNVPVYNSLPGALAVAYLDMDGHVDSAMQWSGTTITARGISTSYTQEQMAEIWRLTSEDYAPFAINVTTDEKVYLATPASHRIRCVITPDNEWYGAAGGAAYVGCFVWSGDTACWVFSDQLADSPRYIAESCSHEIGHTLGLTHDGRLAPLETYYQGQGSGQVGWAPIMGVGYYKTIVQWSKGEYPSANNPQDDCTVITTQNGFGYRADQHADTALGATDLTVTGGGVAGAGIIETRNDVDVFSFTTTGGTVTINVLGNPTSQNLDLLAQITDAAGTTLASDNPDTLTNACVTATLPAGTYFLQVSGAGRGDCLVDGYTDYGSLGQYTISGSVP